MLCKKVLLKISLSSWENTFTGVNFWSSHSWFPMKFAKVLNIPFLLNICKRLLLYLRRYENFDMYLLSRWNRYACSLLKVSFTGVLKKNRFGKSQEHPLRMFCKKDILRNRANFKGKHLLWCPFWISPPGLQLY